MNISKRTLLILAIAVATGLYGLSQQTEKKSVNQAELPTQSEPLNFRLKWLIYSSFGHHFVALEKGYFDKEKVKPEIRAGGAGLDPIKLVASGEDDVGLASYGQILMACEKGIPVVAIAQENISSGVVFISLQQSGITAPEQFVGKKVGIIPGSDTGSVYAAVMGKLKIDRSKIDEVPISFSVDPLINGAVDVSTAAFSTNQPLVVESKGFPVNIIDPKDYGVSVGGNVYFTRPELLKSKPELLRRFLRADLKGIVDSHSMPNAEVVDMVLKHNSLLDKTAELRIWDATKKTLLPTTGENIGVMPRETWEQTKQVFADSGLVGKNLDFSKCYTNELVANILK